MTTISSSETDIPRTITLSGDSLTVDCVESVARQRTHVDVDAEALQRVRAARAVVERALRAARRSTA